MVQALKKDAPPPKQVTEEKKESKPLISVDPVTGKKVYNGPKLRNRKVIFISKDSKSSSRYTNVIEEGTVKYVRV